MSIVCHARKSPQESHARQARFGKIRDALRISADTNFLKESVPSEIRSASLKLPVPKLPVPNFNAAVVEFGFQVTRQETLRRFHSFQRCIQMAQGEATHKQIRLFA